MDRTPSPTAYQEPPDPGTLLGGYRKLQWLAAAACAALAAVHLLITPGLTPEPTGLAPVWGALGLACGVLVGLPLSVLFAEPRAWLCAAAGFAALGLGGLTEWDSIALLARVFAAVSLIVAAVRSLPVRAQIAFVAGCVLLHFSGIMSAVTSPSPQPWISGQAWTRIFRPYLQFTYMNNAYQFYSPDPGPARELWFLIEYQPKPEKVAQYPVPPADGEKGYFRWIKIAERPRDLKDPLGQSYYRLLSITEHAAQFQPVGYQMAPTESAVIDQRRNSREDIPRFAEYGTMQYQPPTILTQRAYLPSYIRHMATKVQHPDFDVRAIKLYRATHNILTPGMFRGEGGLPGMSPYDPTSYMVYFQGSYSTDGTLQNPFDPMLFWLLPIRRKPSDDPTSYGAFAHLKKNDFAEFFKRYRREYEDYVTHHAGYDHLKGGNLP